MPQIIIICYITVNVKYFLFYFASNAWIREAYPLKNTINWAGSKARYSVIL